MTNEWRYKHANDECSLNLHCFLSFLLMYPDQIKQLQIKLYHHCILHVVYKLNRKVVISSRIHLTLLFEYPERIGDGPDGFVLPIPTVAQVSPEFVAVRVMSVAVVSLNRTD